MLNREVIWQASDSPLSKELNAKVVSNSVTRWRDCYFNICAFVTKKFHSSKVVAKICQELNKLPKNCPKAYQYFATLTKFRQIWSHWSLTYGRKLYVHLESYDWIGKKNWQTMMPTLLFLFSDHTVFQSIYAPTLHTKAILREKIVLTNYLEEISIFLFICDEYFS